MGRCIPLSPSFWRSAHIIAVIMVCLFISTFSIRMYKMPLRQLSIRGLKSHMEIAFGHSLAYRTSDRQRPMRCSPLFYTSKRASCNDRFRRTDDAIQWAAFMQRQTYAQTESTNPPLFSFGLIADVQYADTSDAMNFQRTRMRRYRQSLDILRTAVNSWESMGRKLSGAVILGDICDGKANENKTQRGCLETILGIIDSSSHKYNYVFGNHCHYCFTRGELQSLILGAKSSVLYDHRDRSSILDAGVLHYDWSPHPGWRFVFLDSYDVSLIGASNPENNQLARDLLAQNNPNNLSLSGTWFNNLPREKKRWVPYNGGIGQKQLDWFSRVLSLSRDNSERVVVFCHQPVYSPERPQSLVWNSEQLLSIVRDSGNVVMWVAGHDHNGCYNRDVSGVHHLVVPAPIECDEGQVAFGSIDIYNDKLQLKWTGKLPPNATPEDWPPVMPI